MPKFFGELQEASVENLAADPGSSVAGRIWRNSVEERIKTDDGVIKRALLRNDQHAVIGNHATAANNVRLNRGAAALVQLLLGDDVTAEGTLGTSLAALSAKVESYTNAGKPAFGNAGRLIYITDETSFAFDTGSAWNKIRMLRPQIAQAVLTKSGAYSAAIGDGTSFNDASSAAYAITLPAAASNSGESLDFVKIASDASFNAITLTGVTGGTLNTAGEMVRIRSNGSAWVVESRYIPSVMIAATFGVAGGFASTGPASQTSFIKRIGDSAHCRVQFVLGNTAGSTGTVTMPSGLTIDTGKVTAGTEIIGHSVCGRLSNAFEAGSRRQEVVVSSASAVYVATTGSGGNLISLAAINSVFGGGDSLHMNFIIPITGWNG